MWESKKEPNLNMAEKDIITYKICHTCSKNICIDIWNGRKYEIGVDCFRKPLQFHKIFGVFKGDGYYSLGQGKDVEIYDKFLKLRLAKGVTGHFIGDHELCVAKFHIPKNSMFSVNEIGFFISERLIADEILPFSCNDWKNNVLDIEQLFNMIKGMK